MVRWDLVAASSVALTALLLLRRAKGSQKAQGSNGKAQEVSDEETETVEATEVAGDGNDGGNGTDSTSETEDPEEKRLLPLPVVEMVLIAVLVTLLVRGGALLGHTSEEQVKSGILPAEQVHNAGMDFESDDSSSTSLMEKGYKFI